MTGITRPDGIRFKLYTHIFPQPAMFLHWRGQDHTTSLIWQITQADHPFKSPLCNGLTYLLQLKMSWHKFAVITIWKQKTKYYTTNNSQMKNHLETRRILIENTKYFLQQRCWKTLMHLYNNKRRFECFQTWNMHIKSNMNLVY